MFARVSALALVRFGCVSLVAQLFELFADVGVAVGFGFAAGFLTLAAVASHAHGDFVVGRQLGRYIVSDARCACALGVIFGSEFALARVRDFGAAVPARRFSGEGCAQLVHITWGFVEDARPVRATAFARHLARC